MTCKSRHILVKPNNKHTYQQVTQVCAQVTAIQIETYECHDWLSKRNKMICHHCSWEKEIQLPLWARWEEREGVKKTTGDFFIPFPTHLQCNARGWVKHVYLPLLISCDTYFTEPLYSLISFPKQGLFFFQLCTLNPYGINVNLICGSNYQQADH